MEQMFGGVFYIDENMSTLEDHTRTGMEHNIEV